MKILVVDDSSTMRRIVINTLKKAGFSEIVEAGDGKEALGIMTSDKIDFVITDWNMPEMNGLEFVQAVRSDADLKDTPILMVTTRSVKEDILEAMKAGVNSYIVKPFTPQTLKEKINQVLGIS